MSSEYLIAVPHELPQQDNLVNKGKEGKLFDEDYVNNHLEQKFSLDVPDFSCIRNFPFNKNMKFHDIPVPNHTATKRRTLDDELNTSHPKLIKLQSELANYHSGTAVDMVDAVRSQVIKNDVILGEIIENPTINKTERTDSIVEETSLQQLDRETLDACNSDHISVEAIDCAAIEDISCSDRKSSDEPQHFSKMETECAMLKLQDRNDSSASLGTGQDCVTETENLLLNSEKRVFFAPEFADSETVADEYHSVHDSFSLSEFLICPGFEQKVSCEALLHPIQKEVVVGGNSVTAAVDESSAIERIDAHIMFQCESEISGNAGTSFALDSKSDVKDVVDNTGYPLCGTQKLSHRTEEGSSSNMLQNKMPDSVGVGMTLSQTVVKEELLIKQEVEEDSILHTIQVPSVDLLHNRELDLVDDTLFQNWFMSLVNQETVTESVSTSTYDHHESSGSGHSEEAKVEPKTKIGNKIIDRDLPPPDLFGESGYVPTADHFANSAQNCNEGNVTPRFLQNLFPAVADIPCTKKTEASFEKVKNVCDEYLLTGLSTPTLAKNGVTQIPTTNENKTDSAATLEPNVNNNAKSESDTIHKHHKKELIKKFSSGLLNDDKCNNRSSQDNRIQTETPMKDSDLPSTSVAVTNEDKCIQDCIVISDSDDDSIIEFDIVKTGTKKLYTKSTLSSSSGKYIQSSSRKCTRNTRGSTNEESLGQQPRNSTSKNSVIQECIILSDSDDESSKPALPSNHADEAVNISDAESHVSVSDGSSRKRTGSHGVIDLSGGRSPSSMSKSNSAVSSAGDSNVGAFATAFAAGDSQCSLGERLGGHNSGLVTNNSNTFTHIVAATITYNTAQSNFGRESNGSDVIDLSRRNSTPLTASWQNNKTNSALDVLDLSGSDKKQQERHSVIRSVGSATENKSTTKDIAEDKDSSPAWSCPICFESLLSGHSVSSTPCGHVFCTKCIEEAVNQFKKCPTCCRRVALKRVHKIFL